MPTIANGCLPADGRAGPLQIEGLRAEGDRLESERTKLLELKASLEASLVLLQLKHHFPIGSKLCCPVVQ